MDPKHTIALQPMVESTYIGGRYGMTLDYTRPLEPPLPADNQRFADECIAARRIAS